MYTVITTVTFQLQNWWFRTLIILVPLWLIQPWLSKYVNAMHAVAAISRYALWRAWLVAGPCFGHSRLNGNCDPLDQRQASGCNEYKVRRGKVSTGSKTKVSRAAGKISRERTCLSRSNRSESQWTKASGVCVVFITVYLTAERMNEWLGSWHCYFICISSELSDRIEWQNNWQIKWIFDDDDDLCLSE